MVRVQLGSALVLSFILILGAARICFAADYCQLTIVTNDQGAENKFVGEFDLWQNEQWRLETAINLPNPVTYDDEQSIALMLAFFAEDWRWTATAGADRDNRETDWRLKIRGAYDRMPWSLAVTGYREDNDLGLEGYLARRYGPWRIKLWQDIARVDGQSDYQRYASELNVSWRETGKLYNLCVGGTSHRGADKADDQSTYYAEADWNLRWRSSWTFNGGLRWHYENDPPAEHTGVRLSLGLVRRAPLGIKINTSYEDDETGDLWRAGLVFLGTAGPLYWRAGAAGELDPAEPAPEAWVFGILGWHLESWRLELGLTPEGEYAATSRHGYWVSVKYEF